MQSGFTTFLIWVAIIGMWVEFGFITALFTFLVLAFLGRLLDNQYRL